MPESFHTSCTPLFEGSFLLVKLFRYMIYFWIVLFLAA